MFSLAAKKEPNNPAHQMGLGCAYASRAVSIGYAAMFTQMLAQERADYPNKLKKWENGRADFDKMKAEDPQSYGAMNYEDTKPDPPPPAREFATKDDAIPFRLTTQETADRVSDLCQQARQAWEKGVALCKTPEEKAEALYTEAWGQRIFARLFGGFGNRQSLQPL